MAPPQLARDAPRPQVLHPAEVGVLLVLGMEAHAARSHGLVGGLRQLVHAHEPLQRDQRLDPVAGAVAVADLVLVRLLLAEQPWGEQGVTHASRAPRPRSGRRTRRRSSVMRPSKPIAASSARPCRRPISKSLRSWPGVTLSAPVPKSIFTYSSAMIGTSRSTSGTIAVAADQVRGSARRRMHGHSGVGQDRLGPHRRDREESSVPSTAVAHLVQRVDRVLVARTSRSEIVEAHVGHQLIRRLSR